MKTQISAALADFLDNLCTSGTGGYYACIDLYTITLQNGTVLRWAAWPVPITFPVTGIYNPSVAVGGNVRVSGGTYTASGPYLERSRLTQGLKLEVSQIKMTIRANPLMKVGSTPILAAIASGMFADAYVAVDRLFAQSVNPLDLSLGTINRFIGNVAEVDDCARAHAVLSVKDPTALLGDNYPRNIYAAGCRHDFGDAGCTFNKSSVTSTGTVQTGSTTVTIKTNLTQVGGITAPAAPGLSQSADMVDVNIPSKTYYVVVTLTGPNGESGASPETSIAITGSNMPGANGTTDKLLIVNSPTGPAGSTWNVYVGLASGQWQQQAALIPLGTPWQQDGGNLAQGPPPPFQGTSGYFSQGVIQFTSGALSGIAQQVTDYSFVGGAGVITTAPPLPSVPAAGDTFTVIPDCDHTRARCRAYGNLGNYSACDYIPLPEQAV